MWVRRIRANEALVLRAIRLRALADSPSAFSATLAAEDAYPDELWIARAADSSAGVRAATFLASSVTPASAPLEADVPWEGLVTVLGPLHEAGDPKNAELVSMWVAPHARGSGMAQAWVHEAIAFARTTGTSSLRLAVTRGNGRAQRFYEHFGFRLVAEGFGAAHPCHGEEQYSLTL